MKGKNVQRSTPEVAQERIAASMSASIRVEMASGNPREAGEPRRRALKALFLPEFVGNGKSADLDLGLLAGGPDA
jgi:hypothetical protein